MLICSVHGADYFTRQLSWEPLDAGSDPRCKPKVFGTRCSMQTTPAVRGLVCGPMELRCFLLSDDKDGDHRLWKPPMHAHGKTRYPHLVKWEEASILYSLGYLEIVYERSSPAAGEPRYAVVPSQYVRLDDWPEAPRSGQDHADGFSDQTRLRIVLRPGALRVIWWGVLASRAWRRTARSDRPSRRAPPTGRAPSRDWTRSREQILQKLDS